MAGLVIGFAAGEDCSQADWLCFDRGTLALGMGVILGGAGRAGGLIVGSLTSHESWRPVSWIPAPRPLVAPTREGVRVGVSFRF